MTGKIFVIFYFTYILILSR